MEGPLRGVIGVVEATQKRKIVVSIELVGRAVSATLDADAVAPYLPVSDLLEAMGLASP
jgi:transcription antitermination factor NusG